ncbi:hypothetical protein LIER_12760 [Lithospermum erythrorhizon]|uniref:Protein FAR1-RELATED SEQUENCE n=1 Tax=Lithospermum erythrorhizon TaxID=34254 RepID=A0AAV3PUV1_LITER
MKNFFRGKQSHDMSAGDLHILLQFLSKESKTKPSFFYDIQLDEDSLDTTFRTNKKYFPLAAFLGFSHHRQGCIFGAALLHDQTSETFEWLLHVFLKCMGRKRPVSLFTDQDAAMRKAISIVLPDCFHGLCSWHICENATRRLGSLVMKEFFTHFNFLIRDVGNKDDFHFNWKLMIDECFNGVPNSWLQFIYLFRHQWSSVWVKSYFTAGWKSTQVSESFNSFLRDYVSVSYSLPQVFHNFNLMLDHMREKLNKSVYESIQYLPLIRFNHSAIVKQTSQVYTPPIFNLFQDQYSLILEYFVHIDEASGGSMNKICLVFKNDPCDPSVKLVERVVEIDLAGLEWTYSYRKFANWGVLYCHILKAVDIGAWTLPQNDCSSSSTFALRYQAYCASLIQISSLICVDDDIYCYFMKEVNDVLKRVEERVNLTSHAADLISIGSMSTVNNDLEVESHM